MKKVFLFLFLFFIGVSSAFADMGIHEVPRPKVRFCGFFEFFVSGTSCIMDNFTRNVLVTTGIILFTVLVVSVLFLFKLRKKVNGKRG